MELYQAFGQRQTEASSLMFARDGVLDLARVFSRVGDSRPPLGGLRGRPLPVRFAV